MKYLFISDIHLRKNIFDVAVNPYLDISKQELNSIWSASALTYIQEVLQEQNIKEELTIVFLGDVIDTPYIKLNLLDDLFALIEHILTLSDKWLIQIMIGNHDCSSRKQNWSKTPLRYLCNYDARVELIIDTKITSIDNDIVLVHFPYKLRKEILPAAFGMRQHTANKNVCLLSHNNIYITSFFRDSEMIRYSEVKEALAAKNLFIINGHIHHKHYETNYFQPGSVNPTSFKYSPTASGIFLYDFKTGENTQYKNRSIVYLAVNNYYYLEELKIILEEAVKFKAVVFLKFPDAIRPDVNPILKKFKNVIKGIKEIRDKH